MASILEAAARYPVPPSTAKLMPSAASQDILGNSLWIASRPEGGERRAESVFSFAPRSPPSAGKPVPTRGL